MSTEPPWATGAPPSLEETVLMKLAGLSLILTGERGIGKTSIGRSLAARLGLPFVEGETEVEQAAGMSISDILRLRGEPELHSGEQRVIQRLLLNGPRILIVTEDAFMSRKTREAIHIGGYSVWLRGTPSALVPPFPTDSNKGGVVGVRTIRTERDANLAKADFWVAVTDTQPELVAEEILRRIEAHQTTFGRLLGSHLARGSMPSQRGPSQWSHREFASVLGVSERTVRGWLAGTTLPSNIDAIERILFGDNVGYHEQREALRASYYRSSNRRSSVRMNGSRISSFRSRAAITLSEMSVGADISANTLSRAERGLPVKHFAAEAISKFMGVALRDLLSTEQPVLPPVDIIPSAEPRAIQFTADVDGPIDLSPVTERGEHLRQDAGQKADYAELRAKASDLGALGPNRLGRVAGPIFRFLGLPEDVSQVRAKLFWSRANTLRILWQDHQNAITTKPHRDEPDERLLELSVASHLRDLVETINVFVVDDPALMELDAVRPGPQDIDAAKAEATILGPVIDAVISRSDIASEIARDAVSEQLGNVGTPGDHLGARQTNEFARRSLRNFVGELLRRAYSPVRALARATTTETGLAWKGIREGAYRATGAAIATGAATDVVGVTNFSGATVQFVVHHSQALKEYVTLAFQNPTLVEIIEWIVRFGS